MTVYNVKITPLTPVHIGTGNELYPYEYRLYRTREAGRYIYRRFDLNAMLQNLSDSDLRAFTQSLGNMIAIRKFFEDLTKGMGPEIILNQAEASENAYNHFRGKFGDINNALEMNPFIRPPGKDAHAYIPGSSIKGVLKGAWVTRNIDKIARNFGYTYEKKGRRPPTPEPYNVENDDITAVLGLYNRKEQMTRDPFKALKVSDTLGNLETCIRMATSVQLKKGEMTDPGMVQTLTEMTSAKCADDTTRSNGVVECRIIVDEIAQKRFDLTHSINAGEITESANTVSAGIIEQDKKFYSKDRNLCGDALSATHIVEDELNRCRSNGRSCVIRIGWGSGFNSTSLNVASDNPLEIKGRKLADNKYPMGWVRLDWQERS